MDFIGYSNNWKGAPATIVPTNNSDVWGVIYTMSNNDLISLDKQEGVHIGLYSILNITATTPDGTVYNCRSYKQTAIPEANIPLAELPEQRRPSLIYL